MRRKYILFIVIGVTAIIILSMFYISDIRFTREAALKAFPFSYKDEIDIKEIISVEDIDLIVFKNISTGLYGSARIKRYNNFLFRTMGCLEEQNKEYNSSFIIVQAIHDDTYIMAVKNFNPSIKYISNGYEEMTYVERQNLTIDYIKEKPEIYQLKEVEGEYVFFTGKTNDFYKSLYVMGFDNEGNYVEDRFGD